MLIVISGFDGTSSNIRTEVKIKWGADIRSQLHFKQDYEQNLKMIVKKLSKKIWVGRCVQQTLHVLLLQDLTFYSSSELMKF